MATTRPRATSESIKNPHSVSLKVLRLSRPSLAYQHPLPALGPLHNDPSPIPISPLAALANPKGDPSDKFILTPLLNLPSAFVSAHVGETFSCTLSANNELPPSTPSSSSPSNALEPQQQRNVTVTGVRITAEMQTPSNTVGFPLPLSSPPDLPSADDDWSPAPGESLQKILSLDLKEEGNHVLAVTVTYTETVRGGDGSGGGEAASGGKVRTFRKLYQFVARQLLAVRTKAGRVEGVGEGKWVMEAQIENLGEGVVCLESVEITPKSPFSSTSLNWDAQPDEAEQIHPPILNSRDVFQVSFLLERGDDIAEDDEEALKSPAGDTRIVLGKLHLYWRTSLGDKGTLSTGWLHGRLK
ncbi:hypothetical protein K402DRAFT_411805 [Aulographum hederae CBS 113979]|uniref:DUF974-domain-containing protein n=1 Tax=Aulographum hederae CBS 113979 TaxID=1176131 RepID=A0A6G1H449_9PEZI|nr:hypothetical protein K402DRAFT_411805 [Aulographum hederae CBS 113979]